MTKTLKISESLHTKLKTYCSQHKLKLNEWIDELLFLNMQYEVLMELLISSKDLKCMKNKLIISNNPIEIEKLKKQLYLLGDSRIIFVESFLKRLKEENKTLTTQP